MMKANLYECTASYYDFGNSREITSDDIAFYLKVFKPGQRVLEIGCGTGRVGIELAKANITITGLDLSQQMLEIFKSKITPDITDKIDIHYGNMTGFHFGKYFDGIIFPFRVFQALQTDSERRQCFDCLKEHMTDESIAIICMFNPHPEILKNWGAKGIIDFDEYWEDGKCNIRRIQNQLKADYDNQTISVEMIYQKHLNGNVFEEIPDRIELGYLYPAQAEKLFISNGFKIEASYGYYDFTGIKEGEYHEQIYVLKVK